VSDPSDDVNLPTPTPRNTAAAHFYRTLQLESLKVYKMVHGTHDIIHKMAPAKFLTSLLFFATAAKSVPTVQLGNTTVTGLGFSNLEYYGGMRAARISPHIH
jgi:hypothetical protein